MSPSSDLVKVVVTAWVSVFVHALTENVVDHFNNFLFTAYRAQN